MYPRIVLYIRIANQVQQYLFRQSVESSKHFGDALMPLLKQLISNGFSRVDDVYEKLPSELVSFVSYHALSGLFYSLTLQ